MYLNHFGLLPHMHSVFGAWGDGGGVRFWIAYLASLLASLAIAFVTFQFIEWPFLRIRSMWMKTRRTEPVLKATPMHEELVRTS
jgi:peptidoglycan/LPS O-acetylase OafA/YrhL